ncbi:cadherin-15 [Alosa sapidissima]|uniref:cadherin-15 n=1 Tax=Alosa sapidissima TaxID=34773 RepID=UPI001C0974C2|nr:cadherin-15 [Alosa sapidissima]
MELRRLAGRFLFLFTLCQVWPSSQTQQHGLEPAVLYPWRQARGGLARMKRDWIIPPIRVLENGKQVPEPLVQIKSDKVSTGQVIYRLEGPGVNQEPKDLFEIDEKTGWINTKMPLDREKYSSFTLKAFALSPSGERLESPTTIEIYVLDQNDNRPNFTKPQFEGSIREFALPGTSVMRVIAEDKDDPMTDNAILSYSIIKQESFPPNKAEKNMFGIRETTGEIYTLEGIDREEIQAISLTLQVADMSGMGLTSTGHAIINITDINNHGPKFLPDKYKFYAVENALTEAIGKVNATDGDEQGGKNWEVQYHISEGDPNSHFSIITDPVTNQGILSVIKPLDFESSPEHELVLTVSNLVPLEGMSLDSPITTATVTVVVLNENEAPRFYVDPIPVKVPESIVPGTVIAQNIAHDPDTTRLRFEISHDPERWLAINHDTGVVTARQAFNIRSRHVKDNIYRARIKVSDADTDGISTTGTLEISLIETNDHSPQLFPLSATMCSNRQTKGVLLTATDEDMPPHSAPFTFTMLSEANWTVMNINETHAILEHLVDVESGEFSVYVTVSDSGAPQLTSVNQINVTVCPCDADGECKAIFDAIFANRVGLSFIALIVIMSCLALLFLLLLLTVAVGACKRHHMKKGGGLLIGVSDDDIRDNVFNYDEQGGGEEDENVFNIDLLRNPSDIVPSPSPFAPPVSGFPRGRQPLRKDAPHNLPSPTYPRRPPADPTDIEDFINDGLEAADNDPNVPPYDTALIYDYEGDGSLAGSLSTLASASSDGDQDYDYLNDWGPRFKKLANMYDPR